MAFEQDTIKTDGIKFYGGYQVYSDSGVDLTLLRRNLDRSIEQRFKNNSRGIAQANSFRAVDSETSTDQASTKVSPMVESEPILKQLSNHGVEFVLIGGMAMRAHGSACITEDLDICYRRTTENIQKIAKAFAPLHPYLRGAPPGLPFHFDPPTIQAGLNFTLTTDVGDIDLLGEVSGIGNYEKALVQSVDKASYGLVIHVLSIDGLIAAKKAAGRHKDHSHVLELIEMKKMQDATQ